MEGWIIPSIIGIVLLWAIVIYTRQLGIDASTVHDQAAAESSIATALRQIFALSEAYPDLKASTNFLELKTQLSELEDAIQNARRYYNAVVRDYQAILVASADGTLLVEERIEYDFGDLQRHGI